MTASNEPIAIVGSACRFPGGANSPSKLWDLLRDPRDLRTKIPPSRFDVDGFHHPDNSFPGHSNVKHSHLLDENVRQFDSHFFSIAPAEASAMDPQQRLLLETVYEGLETAGFTIEGLRGSNTAVYVGVMFGDYENVQLRDLQHFPTYHATGTARSIMSNRVSYFFDWHGPSWTVDTACSSSLVAVHQAVQSLRSGEAKVAVAAGTNIILGPEPYVSESKVKMLSPDGRSRMWDVDANGYARGEGIAAVFLKPLSAALADGDSIECIIRETGVNQDGRSRGITMPSATAQAALIRETYARAGLDLTKDRCQYFEAHGTGTPAGDPVEAEAVHTAFFGHKKPEDQKDPSPLYVGSIKTIIGHTESTAGLAGVLKVAQALKNGFIPPNRLLNKLNPDVLPFYDHLEIPQELIPWPEMLPGQVRRASVNSFGFGGTNAHAIIESYEIERPKPNHAPTFAPFVFSAQSKQSLAANIAAYANYLKENPETSPANLSWTLRSRRSRLPLRVTFPASPIEDLRSNLEEFGKSFQLDPKVPSTGNDGPKLLGVFTGQGAQYARMGAELIETSAHASQILFALDECLSQLPAEDRPSTSLRQELFEAAETSRVATAAVSQPLCTAVQIILVDLLQSAGIRFSAVVGHSSGEIGAAYAAGYLSASDAICIAYYRGLHTHLAAGENGSQGAMLAVGTSQEDASEVCNDEQFKGRVNVAACNSPASVTLSGDEEAIEEIKELFEDEGKFVRRLRVDKAYHSHHMLRCSQVYLDSIKPFSTIPKTDGTCTWVSSVDPERKPNNMEPVDASYWVDNMVSPVLFKQAIERASNLGPFDGAIEVGPHPALKGPVRETLQSLQVDVPYTGLLHRQTGAIQSFSGALGYLWAQVDNLKIDFDEYEKAVGGQMTYSLIKDLPAYQWNHTQEYWHESPLSQNFRQRSHTVHPLLGDLSPQSSANQLIWKLVMRPKDLPWVHGHQVQGQTVFPAAGYVSTALETVPFIVGDDPVQLVEIENIRIHQAMVLDNENEEAGIDVQFSVNNINRDPESATAHFTYEATVGSQGVFELISSGELRIRLGEASSDTLPASSLDEPYMVPVPSDKLYSELKDIGYGYSGPFRALESIMRKLWKASGSISVINDETRPITYAVHPGLLDAAFHSVILALSYPGDRQLWSLHIPISIDKIRFNPTLCGGYWLSNDKVPFVASAQDPSQVGGYQGDAEVHSSDGKSSAIQIEGLKVVPLSEATQADDREMFHLMNWVDAEANADMPEVYKATPKQRELANIFLRASCFYLREIQKQIPDDHPGRADKFNAAYLDFAAHNTKLCQEGKHRYAKREWLNDTLEDIVALTEPHAHLPEVRALNVVGEHMPRAIRGETSMVEQLLMTGLLDDYYATGLGYKEAVEALADTVKQICQRYPNMSILEVGSGTGSATRLVFDRIGHAFSNFTYTDISTGFFGNAQEEFKQHKDQMTYAVLDLEQDLQGQGFKKHSYDMILSSLVVHATKHLEDTMRRVRSLLKPGGYLVMTECTDVDASQVTTLFGCLPGWWLGMDEGRRWGPCISESDWDALLRKVGFSGIETMTPTEDALVFPNSVIVSRAVDDWVDFVREPLLSQSSLFAGRPVIDSLFIIGGSSFRNSRLIDEVRRHIGVYCESITHVKLLESLDHTAIDSNAIVLVLQDLDQPVFEKITEERFESLKKLFSSEKSIIWVTQNRLSDNPYANLPVGFARSALSEVAELRYQFIDFEGVHKIDSRVLSEAVLRFQAAGSARQQSQRNALWSVEQEIVINADGQQRVPRLRPYDEANDRFNSSRRSITKQANPEAASLEISKKNGRYAIIERSTSSTARLGRSDSTLQLKSSHTSAQAIKTPLGDAFVFLGNCATTGAQYLGLTQCPVSSMDIARETLVPCSIPLGSEAAFVSLVASHLLFLTVSSGLGKDDTLIINDSPAMIAILLDRQLSTTGINTFYTSSSKATSKEKGWLHVDQYHRQSHLKSVLPKEVSRFVDFASQSSPISSCLPAYTSILNSSVLFPETLAPHPCHSQFTSKLMDMLTQAAHFALSDLETWDPLSGIPDLINVQELSGREVMDPLTVIEWKASSVPVTVEPVKYQFRQDRTYWLVGLTGDMGLSIANWMIQSGARNLVLTSRNPKIEKSWLANAEGQGAVVRVMKNDLIDFSDLERVHREITETMPPIAGVAQGAMVMRDAATREMTYDELMQSLRPKVEGSLNLDRLFYDEPLDFFVFFSSSASVIGHPGQANYTAGNAFMCGLAEQRRHRGLNASAINLGPVLGTGYITRELSQWGSQSAFERGFVTLSESDVHHTVAEAIHSSQHTSGAKSQVTTGLRHTPATDATRAQWYTFPQFSCMTLKDFGNGVAASSGQEGIPLSEQLANATTKDEVREIIADTFTTDLRNMLMLGNDYELTLSVRTDELGLDSLVAVRLRSWFLNNFQVNIPVLKILKGVSIQNLLDQTLDEMPQSLTPNIGNTSPPEPGNSEHATSNNPSETTSEKHETPLSSYPHTPTEEVDKELKEEAAPEQKITRCGELSYSQSMFLFAHRLLNDKTTMNTTAMVNLRGDIRVSDLRQAIETIVKRHESLRTCFYERDGQFVQGVMESSPLTLEHKKIYNKQELFKEYEGLGKFVYDLSTGQAIRFILLSYSPRDHYFLLGYHHIIFDRTSQNAFMAELQQLYDGGDVPYQPLQYLDWSNQQHELYNAGRFKAMVDFWRREFATVPEPLPLHRSLISARLPLEEYSFHTKQVRIHTETAAAVRDVARKHRSTPFHLHLAVFKALLYRFLGSADICIGVTDNGRMDDSMQTGIGPFVNTVFVRMAANGEQTFGDAVQEARDKSISALSNPLPLELIFNVTQVTRASTHTPLGQAFLNYSEVELQDGETFLGCKMTTMDQHPAKLPYDITCTVVNHGAGHTDVWLNVQQALYTEEDAQLLVHGYEDILAELTESPTNPVGSEWQFRESLVEHALTVGRGPNFRSTRPQTLVHRFNDIATSFGSRAAVKDNTDSLTYAALVQNVDAIASKLLHTGVQPGSRVAIFQHPSIHWAASVLAILKVGGVYVPLDASNPVARLALIVQDSQPTTILVHNHTVVAAEGLEAPVTTTIIDISQIPKQAAEAIPTLAQPDSPAIILYTSGSTGVPKGVILQHASLKHEFDHCAATYGLSENDVVLQQSAWSFDLSVTQIFLALGVGATLQIAPHTMRPDARAMTDLIKNQGVTATYATPTEYKSWLRRENQQSLRSASWKLALVAGEAVTEPLLQLFRETDLTNHRLFNVYGPTETTCGSTKLQLDYKTPGLYSKSVPVGRASANESFYILDRNQKPLPCGQPGEVAIAGVGVAMGYLNNEERTQASFILDPYAPQHYIENGWTKMYRTGDLGLLQKDGTLILQGRIEGDTEVKLNGVRIDLGDIEQTVLKAANGSLSDAIASLRSFADDQAKFMVVHVIFSSETSAADKSAFLGGLAADLPLPRTMRPSAIIPVDSLPRTIAGKVDRKAISQWSISGVLKTPGYTVLSKAEGAMKCMWEAVLPDELIGLHQVNADSDFFAVGGSSMSLIELQNKIKEKTNVLVPLLRLFQNSTLRGMSGLIGSEELERSNRIDWDAEVLLQPELASLPTLAEVVPPQTRPQVIVLTGSTGFLGQHLARELCSQSHVEKVICIAMRNVRQKRAVFAGMDKIECHEGDLRLPLLGLPEEEANSIFQQADAVVHNGADVSHLKNYTSLRTANVQSTQELVKLCLPRMVPLHFVSSTGVSMYSDLRSFPEISMRTSPPSTDGHDGYSSSKWVSEVYLENVHAAYGLPIHIHRPSSIIRPREQFTGDDPVDDVIQGMMEYSRRISAVPVVPGTRGTLDLVKPETVAKKLVRAVMAQHPSNQVIFVHESGDLVLKDTEMADHIAKQSGDAVAEIPLEEWISRAQAAGLSNSLVAVFQGLASNKLNFPEVLTRF